MPCQAQESALIHHHPLSHRLSHQSMEGPVRHMTPSPLDLTAAGPARHSTTQGMGTVVIGQERGQLAPQSLPAITGDEHPPTVHQPLRRFRFLPWRQDLPFRYQCPQRLHGHPIFKLALLNQPLSREWLQPAELLKEDFGRGALGQCPQPLHHLRLKAAMPPSGMGIQYLSAANGHRRRWPADDEAVSGGKGHWMGEAELRIACGSRLNHFLPQHPHSAWRLCCAYEERHRIVMGQWLGCVLQEAHFHINQAGRLQPPRCGHHIPSLQLAGIHPCQVDGYPTAWQRSFQGLLMGLQAPDTRS